MKRWSHVFVYSTIRWEGIHPVNWTTFTFCLTTVVHSISYSRVKIKMVKGVYAINIFTQSGNEVNPPNEIGFVPEHSDRQHTDGIRENKVYIFPRLPYKPNNNCNFF